jgi:DNA-binding transcriptional MerR regulator
MTIVPALVTDLKARWYSLHDLDRAQAVRVIHQLGVSLRELARHLNCSPSLLSHLLQAGQASIADCILARQGALSTRALVRNARTEGTRRTASGHEEVTYEMERAAHKHSRAILRWLGDEDVLDVDQEQVIDQAGISIPMAKQPGQVQRNSMVAVVSTDDTARSCWPVEPGLSKARLLAGHAQRLAARTVLGIPDDRIRQRAFELARDKLAGGRSATRGMHASTCYPSAQSDWATL